MITASAPESSVLARASKWLVIGYIQNATTLGFPSRRRRSWRNAINQDVWIWMGPREEKEVQMHFDSIFKRSVEMDGDALLVASSSDRKVLLEQQARSRGNFIRPGDPADIRATMSTLSYQRFVEFQEEFNRKRVAGDSRAFVGDFSQNIEARRRCSEVLPAVTTSSTMYSFSRDLICAGRDWQLEMIAA